MARHIEQSGSGETVRHVLEMDRSELWKEDLTDDALIFVVQRDVLRKVLVDRRPDARWDLNKMADKLISIFVHALRDAAEADGAAAMVTQIDQWMERGHPED